MSSPEPAALLRDRILVATLPHVAFDGWSRTALKAGTADAGFGASMAARAFPGGAPDLVEHFADWVDRRIASERARWGAETRPLRGFVPPEAHTPLRELLGRAYAPDEELLYRIVDGAVNGVGSLVDGGGWLLRRLQTGSVRAYASSVFLGVVLILGYYLWRP